jgi:hypothetical protein
VSRFSSLAEKTYFFPETVAAISDVNSRTAADEIPCFSGVLRGNTKDVSIAEPKGAEGEKRYEKGQPVHAGPGLDGFRPKRLPLVSAGLEAAEGEQEGLVSPTCNPRLPDGVFDRVNPNVYVKQPFHHSGTDL